MGATVFDAAGAVGLPVVHVHRFAHVHVDIMVGLGWGCGGL